MAVISAIRASIWSSAFPETIAVPLVQRAHWRALARFLARTQFGVGDDASKVLSPNATPESRALGSEVVELCENDSYHNNHHPKAVESGAS
jgi:hypothetical protein